MRQKFEFFQNISDIVTYKHTDIHLRNWGTCLRFGARGMSFLDTLSSYSRIDFSGIVNAKWSVGHFQIPDQICGEKLQKYNSLKSEMAYEKYIASGALVISRFLIGSAVKSSRNTIHWNQKWLKRNTLQVEHWSFPDSWSDPVLAAANLPPDIFA